LAGKTIFKVLTLGSVVLDYNIGISVDVNNKFYYNSSSNSLTDSSSDLYVGIWKASDYLLTIDNNDVLLNFSSSGGGGGGDYPLPTRTVILDPNVDPVEDKVFDNWSDVDTYVQGQMPATDSRWTIIVNGTIAEAITMKEYVNIQGNYNNTEIQQVVSTLPSFGLCEIRGCIIKDIFQDDNRSDLYFDFVDCVIDCSAFTDLTHAKMKFTRCQFDNFDIPDASYTYCNEVYLHDCKFTDYATIVLPDNENSTSHAKFYSCDFKTLVSPDIQFNGGTFYNCNMPSINNAPDDVLFNGDYFYSYVLYNCNVNTWVFNGVNFDVTISGCNGFGEVYWSLGTVSNDVTIHVYDYSGIIMDSTFIIEHLHQEIKRIASDSLTEPPTASELSTLFDSSFGRTALVEDTNTNKLYFCTSYNNEWYYVLMTLAEEPS